jgi:hypothetical protein
MVLSVLARLVARIRNIEQQGRKMQEALGRIENRQLLGLEACRIADSQFGVFSQWGEDGIIQHLLRHVPVSRKVFIEFGVENYTESNTRFLLINDQWAGLVFDGSQSNIDFIRNDGIYWRHNLKAIQAFVTRENINDLIQSNGLTGEVGLLSIDIDGNDYWVWDAINVVSPAIVIVEYNARFGPEKAVTIPYDANFSRTSAPGSGIYYGASLSGLANLGRRKGYALVGSNSAGNNAFFVKRILKPESLPELTPREAFVRAQFRETREPSGELLFLDQSQEESILEHLPLVDAS